MTKNDTDIEQILENKFQIEEAVFLQKFTKSHYFLTPLVLSPVIVPTISPFYCNTYFNDKERLKIKREIILIHLKLSNLNESLDPSLSWYNVLSTLIEQPTFAYYYYVGNDNVQNEIIIAFKIPDNFIQDFDLILKGFYSKTSSYYQNVVCSFFKKQVPTNQLLKGIFSKAKWVKEETEEIIGAKIDINAEYWDTFMYPREIFRIKT